jgi:putative FmdB family regulatory protein
MPIYEYRCDQGHTFEVMQRMTDEPVRTCRTCEQPVQRVFHPVAVHFKGSGFYNTDYGKQRRGRGGEGEGESGDASSTDGKKPDSEKKSAGEEKASSDGKAAGDGASKTASAGSSSS